MTPGWGQGPQYRYATYSKPHAVMIILIILTLGSTRSSAYLKIRSPISGPTSKKGRNTQARNVLSSGFTKQWLIIIGWHYLAPWVQHLFGTLPNYTELQPKIPKHLNHNNPKRTHR